MNVKSNPLSFSIGMRDETSIRGKNQPTGSGVSYNLEASYLLYLMNGVRVAILS